MRNLREILLSQYIGAVAVGLILSQAVFVFINALVQAGATYWAILQTRSVLADVPEFSWKSLIASMITVALYLVVCFLSIRWLYSEPKASASDAGTDETGMEQQ